MNSGMTSTGTIIGQNRDSRSVAGVMSMNSDLATYGIGRKKKKNWIGAAIKHPGLLRQELDVPAGQKIPQDKLDAAAHAKGKLGQRARFAETLRGMRKG